jgi:hypothetical protein
MACRNLSSRCRIPRFGAIQGFAFVTTFTDSDTDAVISTWNRACYRQVAAGPALAAGPGEPSLAKCNNGSPRRGSVIASGAGPEPIGNPLSVPANSSGALAKYYFTVDLVFFSDGTTWGPAETGAARSLQMFVTKNPRTISYGHRRANPDQVPLTEAAQSVAAHYRNLAIIYHGCYCGEDRGANTPSQNTP